jgi:hypothetical protein|tara:strand:+ start:3481 stop:3606 length:126 start_codon:yes stop_codon:yes gene_type:complete
MQKPPIREEKFDGFDIQLDFFLRRGGEDMVDAFCTVHSRKA